MPYRLASPPEPTESDDDPYVEVIRSQQRRTRLVAAAVGLTLFAALTTALARPRQRAPRRNLEAERFESARASIEDAKDRAREAQRRFEEATRAAIAERLEVGPGANGPGCGTRTLPVSEFSRSKPAFPMVMVTLSQLGDPIPSPTVAAILADVRRAEEHLRRGRYEEARLYAQALAREDRFGFDVVLLAKELTLPRVTSPSSYEPGAVRGRAYVYDFAEDRVVCNAEVRATNSRQIGYAYAITSDAPASLGQSARLRSSIDEDMEQRTERAVVAGLGWSFGSAR